MANATWLDPADKTPPEVIEAIGANRKAYPSDKCIPCGAVIHIGFFFDGFARHRDYDDKSTSRYSNICRLWEAHRDNQDRRRDEMPNRFWYPFYYSGLGTELNKEARDGEVTSALALKVANAAKDLPAKAEKVAQKVAGVDRLMIDPKGALTDGFKKGLEEHSFRPVVDSFKGLMKQAKSAPTNAGRVLRFARTGIVIDRARSAVRILAKDAMRSGPNLAKDIKGNPLKVGWGFAREVFRCAFDVVPIFRDNRVVAFLLGTGVEPRLEAARKQFKNAVEDARSKMPKVQRIQVSVFGADRGGVIARAFLNDLTEEYKHPSKAILEYKIPKDANGDTIPVEIVFVGLFDAVSSLMEENKIVSLIPLVGSIKQDYGNENLAIPESVQRCVHFAAAHELRSYQRLDSLENTRAVQYLYPGTSEDITGGAPPGELGARAELQRAVLRDMLNEGLSYGVALDCMEDLAKFKVRTFQKFTLAKPIVDDQTTYKIGELIKAYRDLVPYVSRLTFLEHMQIFLRWMAVRYTSPEFRETVTNQFDMLDMQHQAILKNRNDAQAAYEKVRNQSPPADLKVLAAAQDRLDIANSAEMHTLQSAVFEKHRPSVGVWERIDEEVKDMVQRESKQSEMRKQIDMNGRAVGTTHPDPYYQALQADRMNALLSSDQETLLRAWKLGLSGKHPLPPKVMALFDLLVHDTMLTSWHDHILSSSLYFRTRGVDTFGSSDYVAEEKNRKRAEANASRASQISRGMSPAARN